MLKWKMTFFNGKPLGLDSSQESDPQPTCIINHEGFQPVYLDVCVVQTAYLSYRHHHGKGFEES